jgi:hypothetical protein
VLGAAVVAPRDAELETALEDLTKAVERVHQGSGDLSDFALAHVFRMQPRLTGPGEHWSNDSVSGVFRIVQRE